MGDFKKLPLSVLDLCPILSGVPALHSVQHSIELAKHVEALGFKRYWLAEHHNMDGIGSSSPEVLIAHVAMATKDIRVGSGGVMLSNHSPLRIAEAFRTLEAFHPGRIDLGLGRAPGTGGLTALVLRGSTARLEADDFPEQLDDLMAFLSDSFPEGHPYRSITAVPKIETSPEVWMLGSSDFGARLAAQKGLPYAFAQHFSTLDAVDTLELYRSHFKPSAHLNKPHAMLAIQVVCAETDEEAYELSLSSDLSFYLFRSTGKSMPLPTVAEAKAHPMSQTAAQKMRANPTRKFVGSPETVLKHLTPMLETAKPDELMVLTMVHNQEARRRSYELFSTALM